MSNTLTQTQEKFVNTLSKNVNILLTAISVVALVVGFMIYANTQSNAEPVEPVNTVVNTVTTGGAFNKTPSSVTIGGALGGINQH